MTTRQAGASVRLVHLAVPVLLFVTACGTEPGTPVGTPAPPTSTTKTTVDVPAVEAPLKPGRFAEDPCALLGDANRAALELPTAQKKDEVGGPACDLSVHGGTSAGFLKVKFNSGLEQVAYQCEFAASVNCDGWSVTMIEGYPAIMANGDFEARYGSCKLLLGISEDASVLLVDARTTLVDTPAPDCGRAEQAATMVIAALREGN